MKSSSRYTLLIPTYNRPADLRSLLGYLGARGFDYPIRILDSSSSEGLSQNRDTIAAARLDIAHQVYDSATPVAIKFADGAKSVETPYCSFCADDDVLFTDHLAHYLDVLDADAGFVAAHGYYINFKPGDHFDISDVVYRGPSIAGEDALKRIAEQMGDYQAIFYAIHRTGVMRSVLLQLERVQSVLARELLSSSLTLIAGGVYRLPHFYMARNTNPSIAFEGWHPHQFLATNPDLLFREYTTYRAVVLEHLMADAQCRSTYRPDQMERIIDVVHLKYLAPMLSPPIMDYIIAESLRPGREPRDIVRGLWEKFATPPRNAARWTRVWLNRMKRVLLQPRYALTSINDTARIGRLFSMLRFRESLDVSASPGLDKIYIDRTTRDARHRRYRLSREFLERQLSSGRRVTAANIVSILWQLDDYV